MAELTPLERVDKGIARLNSNGPDDWRSLINIDDLDVSNIFTCPLGQVYGSFAYGVSELGIMDLSGMETYEHGFDVFDDDDEVGIQELNNAWYFRLTELRKD